MRKIVNPCLCEVGSLNKANAYAVININDGRLSIHGVIGPMSNGNCRGGAGQCIDEFRAGEPNKGWTREMLDRFCDVWQDWHLNDMRPYCEHQKVLGWDKIAEEEVILYHYIMTYEAITLKKEAEDAALDALMEGKSFIPTEVQTKYENMPYEVTTYEEKELLDYEPRKSLYSGGRGFKEITRLGNLYQHEHPRGILGRPCPICGYKYGTSWKKEELPQDVIDFLSKLPVSKREPAWI